MFIAHLPAGYLLSQAHPSLQRHAMQLMIGATLPYIDLFWFYLIDSSATHHTLLPHRPILWFTACGLGLMWRWIGAVGMGALLHLSLDSVAGQIAWGWPLWDNAQPIVFVPATQGWWVMSFLIHWTFLIELTICAAAAAVWVHHRCTLRSPKL